MNAKVYLIFADALLITHTLIVLFIVIGFILIWIGRVRRWSFVKNFYFRLVHLGAMGWVAAQTVLGADCPLTIWENALREKAGAERVYEQTFIGHWLQKFLFFDVTLQTFAVIYVVFFVLIMVTWVAVKPVWPRKKSTT